MKVKNEETSQAKKINSCERKKERSEKKEDEDEEIYLFYFSLSFEMWMTEKEYIIEI